ncbi:saccharopine dehydrogenase [Streptomyces sp. NPDC002490]|uniref:saccharopine dehydrogenase n=1 Tax=Streptomyces sp. NPDC002490 TaxID=3154416 RepID=UPI003326E85B
MAAPRWPLLLAGRTVTRGEDLARRTGAALLPWDLADPSPVSTRVRAVVTVVNDPDDRVLRAAVHGGVPYVDLTRWTARLQRAATVAALLRPTAPVLLSSAWMGGVASLVVADLARTLGGADRVDVAIRWDQNDRAGVDSVEFMDRLGLDFEVIEDGQRRTVMPLADSRTAHIDGTDLRVARIDTPEQFTLPLTLGTVTASTRIGFSSALSTSALLAAKRLGFFRWARGERFTPLRRSLLHAPGNGGTAALRVDVTHRGRTGSATVTDPAGQAHLTAVGGLLALDRVLGTDGAPAPASVAFPEQTPLPAALADRLAAQGVTLEKTVEAHGTQDRAA